MKIKIQKRVKKTFVVLAAVILAVCSMAFSVSADETSNTVLSGSYSFNDSLSTASFDLVQYDVSGTVTLFDFEIGEEESFSFTQFAIGTYNGSSFIGFSIDGGAVQLPLPSDGSMFFIKSITFDSSFSVTNDVYEWFISNQYKPSSFLGSVTDAIGSVLSWVGIPINEMLNDGGALVALLPLFAIGISIAAIFVGIKLIRSFTWGN